MSTDVSATPHVMTTPRSRRPRRTTHAGAWALLAVAWIVPILGAAPAPRGAGNPPIGSPTLAALRSGAIELGDRLDAWYRRTPPAERVSWGGLAACALLGLGVAVERTARVRRSRIIPIAFVERFQTRLGEGGLERGKALDYCELNPSPAARVALAAVRRWGRSTTDLERGVSLARQVEVDRLRSHLGTLRRVAGMAPLVGLLGTLTTAGRILAAVQPGMAWGPALAGALAPLTAGVAIAILALLAFDGLTIRAESLAADLDRIGAETIDAIALATPLQAVHVAPPRPATKTPTSPGSGATVRPQPGHGHPTSGGGKVPHSLRFPMNRKVEGH